MEVVRKQRQEDQEFKVIFNYILFETILVCMKPLPQKMEEASR